MQVYVYITSIYGADLLLSVFGVMSPTIQSTPIY